jgi:hypothetical protein
MLKTKKPRKVEDAMQRKARLEKLAKAGDVAKKKLGIAEKSKRKTKGIM